MIHSLKIENYKLKIHKEAILLYGCTEPEHPLFSPDMLWRTGFRAPDPFYCLISYSPSSSRGEQASILVSRLEYGRAKKEAKVDKVFLHESTIADFLKTQKIISVQVPAFFPVGIAEHLKRHVKLEIAKGDIFPERAIKTAREVKEIEEAGRAVGDAINIIRSILKKSRITGASHKVVYRGKLLTSEFLREAVEREFFARGYLASGTIISSGKDTAYPHFAGSGPIYARMPIVCDIFPRSKKTNYYADITRTLFKGEPPEPIRRMYQTVLDAQTDAIKKIHSGIDAYAVHKGVVRLFEKNGYKTIVSNKRTEGFIHGLGHGVGIEIHEAPRVGGTHHILEAGNVITIEPGLYYSIAANNMPQGGVRIEDMLLVTKNGHKMLSPIPKSLTWAIIP